MPAMTRHLYTILSLFLAACSLSRADAVTPNPTATTVLVSPVPTLNRDLQPVASLIPSETAVRQSCDVSEIPIARHAVVADVNYAKHAVAVQQDIRYINRTGFPLSQIILSVEPNRWLGAFLLESLVQVREGEESSLGYALTGHRLQVDIPQPTLPECELHLRLKFQIAIPQIGTGLDAYHGFFGYSPRQLNLGHWLPTVAVWNGDKWVTHEAIFIGEQYVLEVADWDVTLSVSEAAESLLVAAPGEMTELGDRTWRYNLRAARDFTVSLSEQFDLTTQITDSGITVELYSFPDALVTTDSGQTYDAAAQALDVSAKSLNMYSDVFGEYPYERMVVVMGDFPDGMEFSGLVFVSADWFHRYDGTPTDYLTVITVHEVAHQWWYASVGNDAALYPWLDEALATYSEYIFFEEYYPDLKDWWWEWRVDRYAPQGFVDSTVYEFANIREYINAIYLRGVHLLHDLRQDLGTEAFFALLRDYASSGAGRIATPDLFWSLLTPEQAKQTLTTRYRYLREPEISSTEGN
jgi:hypothetical protein